MTLDTIKEIYERAILINRRTSSTRIRAMSKWIIDKCEEEFKRLKELEGKEP